MIIVTIKSFVKTYVKFILAIIKLIRYNIFAAGIKVLVTGTRKSSKSLPTTLVTVVAGVSLRGCISVGNVFCGHLSPSFFRKAVFNCPRRTHERLAHRRSLSPAGTQTQTVNTVDRHPGKGRDPMLRSRHMMSVTQWFPACAGMTNLFKVRLRQKITKKETQCQHSIHGKKLRNFTLVNRTSLGQS